MAGRRSQIQRQVLSLYKNCLRSAENKPGIKTMVRNEFKKQANVPKTDIMRIEHLVRNGQRKLKMIQDPNVKAMGKFTDEK